MNTLIPVITNLILKQNYIFKKKGYQTQTQTFKVYKFLKYLEEMRTHNDLFVFTVLETL